MKSHFNSIERILELQETRTWEASWEVKEESKVEENIFSIYIYIRRAKSNGVSRKTLAICT